MDLKKIIRAVESDAALNRAIDQAAAFEGVAIEARIEWRAAWRDLSEADRDLLQAAIRAPRELERACEGPFTARLSDAAIDALLAVTEPGTLAVIRSLKPDLQPEYMEGLRRRVREGIAAAVGVDRVLRTDGSG